MQNKQIDVDCPCCTTRLTVDVLTQTVVRAVSPQELDAFGDPIVPGKRWDSAKERVDQRSASAEDRLESALNEEKGKESHLDDLFKKANEKIEKRKRDQEEF
ncbi:MAG: hypothetical protein ACI8X5_003569 [Planctomycetota bacterium]|jgi:hypothetical protein